MIPFCEINDEEWARIVPLLSELRSRLETRGRPLADTRAVLNGVLWVIYTGAAWHAMPRRYPSYQTCHRRFKQWYDTGVLRLVMSELFGEEGERCFQVVQSRMRKSTPEVVSADDAAKVGEPCNPVWFQPASIALSSASRERAVVEQGK